MKERLFVLDGILKVIHIEHSEDCQFKFAGTALATGGEDGIVKIWSQSGMHRSTLAKTGYSIYAIAWDPDSEQVLFTQGTALVIRPIQSTSKQVEWEAHESLILTVDWNPVNNCIVSAGEDCRYKWLYSKTKLETGSVQGLAWSTDGTQITGAAGNGFIMFGQLVARQIEWERIIASLEDFNRIRIQDVLNETVEELDFRDRIIKMSLNSNHLVVVTETQASLLCISAAVRFLDASKGKLVGEMVRHSLEILVISLNQMGSSADRKLVFIDRNHDLYITPIHRIALFKLGSMIDDAIWHDNIDILVAVSNQKLVVWYYPHAAYVDKDLLKYIKLTKECIVGESSKIQSFHGSRCTVRRRDGAKVFTDVSPYCFLLFEHFMSKQWDHALRLCRIVKDDLLWACLAAMAVDSKELNTAEVAYAALNEVDKVHFMLHVKELASEDGRQAELALFKRRPDEAETILLQAGLIYRAIKMHTRHFNWDRALELGLLHKPHLDTVLWLRQQHLKTAHLEESKQQFLQLNQQASVDEQKVLAKIEEEKEKESHCQRVAGHQFLGKHQLAHAAAPLAQGSVMPKSVPAV
ncbi:hypothetical protein R1flu_023382 [Riccia fluitans]|uniref:Intraflagellar transport protein 80 homolog n=1 Tax=Riccia fluitans TaxID=41844 RepID=A0ABD1XRV4_9MARC